MNCKECYKYLGEYVDRTLVDGASVEVEAHLQACPKCASLAAELKGVASLVRSLDRQGAPVGFESRLNARISRRKEKAVPGLLARLFPGVRTESYGYRRTLKPALAAAMLAATIGTSFMLSSHDAGRSSSTDFAYIDAVRQQHVTYASANPLSDESALILSDRVKDIRDSL